MNELCLEVGVLSIRLRSDGFSFARLADTYRPFLRDTRGAIDLDVVVHAGSDGGTARSADRAVLRSAIGYHLGDGGHQVSDRAKLAQWQVDMGCRLLSSPGFVDALQAYHPSEGRWQSLRVSSNGACFVDGDARQAKLFLISEASEVVARQLSGYLSVLVNLSLVERRGLVLHAAGAVNGAGAHVFMGPSGTGKTTIARVAKERGWSVLADDGLVVRRMLDGRFRAFRTPWNAMAPPWDGSFGPAPYSAPIRAVLFPRHGMVERWERLRPLVGSVRMVEAAFPTLKLHEEEGNPAAALALLTELSREVPCYDLCFSLSCDFIGQMKE